MTLVHDPAVHKLGRPNGPSTGHGLKMATFVDRTKIQAPPLAVIPTAAPASSGVWTTFGNDTLSNCTCATWADALITDALAKGKTINFTTTEVVKMYEASGYSPDDPSTDQGWSMEAAASFMQHTGLTDTAGAQHLIGPWVQLNWLDFTEIQIGFSLFGSLPVGVNLPISAQTQTVWDTDGSATADQKPGSWGGHSLMLAGFDHLGGWFRTWGGLKRFTWAWWARYVDEVLGKINPMWCSDANLSPAGFNIADLMTAQVTLHLATAVAKREAAEQVVREHEAAIAATAAAEQARAQAEADEQARTAAAEHARVQAIADEAERVETERAAAIARVEAEHAESVRVAAEQAAAEAAEATRVEAARITADRAAKAEADAEAAAQARAAADAHARAEAQAAADVAAATAAAAHAEAAVVTNAAAAEPDPRITGTAMQLAFNAWQVKRADYYVSQADLTPAGLSWQQFGAWWEKAATQGFASLHDMSLQAWRSAKTISEPNHGDLHHFNAWWQTVVDSQPELIAIDPVPPEAGDLEITVEPSVVPIVACDVCLGTGGAGENADCRACGGM